MPVFYSAPARRQEPQSRFYPPQGANTQNEPPIPGAPAPGQSSMQRQTMPQAPNRTAPTRNHTIPMQQPPSRRPNQSTPMQQAPAALPNQNAPMQQNWTQVMPQIQEHNNMPHRNSGNTMYFEQRHPLMLQRLYGAADSFLSSYGEKEFIYDTYPDYLSLRLMRDRLLRENQPLTEEFLHAGCPIEWLELLADAITSELLCRRRQHRQL